MARGGGERREMGRGGKRIGRSREEGRMRQRGEKGKEGI